MFRKITATPETVTVFIDGQPVQADPSDTVAAVLVQQAQSWSRKTSETGRRRAPFCMMGVCFDCLATVDGVSSTQTCLVRVRDGQRIDRQQGRRVAV